VSVCVCVCVCFCVCLYVCEVHLGASYFIFGYRKFVTDYCVVTNTDSLAQAAVLSETQTVTHFTIQLLFTSVTQVQLQLCGSSIILSPSCKHDCFPFLKCFSFL